ncbi:MAG TPA: rRNA adenine dimethyltransferase family protein [Candidatus Paceibacterota bacterium]
MFQKKSLGQNFLRSEKALNQMADAGDITEYVDNIVEIGPGEGVLTEKILNKRPKNLVLIEKDDRLIPILCEKFDLEKTEEGENRYESKLKKGKTTKITLIHEDTTEIESFPELFRSPLSKDLTENPVRESGYKVIANIPYYITGLIIRQLFSQAILPETVVLLMQKEVVDRVVSQGTDNEGKESLLSASIKFYGTPKKVAVVPKGAFVPAPTVDSAILSISNIKKPEAKLEQAYFEIAKRGFAHKRKRLAKNLDGVLGKKAKEWEEVLAKESLDVNVRAEEISSETYARLAVRILNDIA